MGQAQETMDRITEAVRAGDRKALAALYAQDAVADTPEGRLTGREAITDWLLGFSTAFPDLNFDMISSLESGDTAADEGYVHGTHTGPLEMPDGSQLAPTGRRIRLREADVVTVRDGQAVSHRFYFDQVEFMTQMGLMDETVVLPDAQRTPTRS